MDVEYVRSETPIAPPWFGWPEIRVGFLSDRAPFLERMGSVAYFAHAIKLRVISSYRRLV